MLQIVLDLARLIYTTHRKNLFQLEHSLIALGYKHLETELVLSVSSGWASSERSGHPSERGDRMPGCPVGWTRLVRDSTACLHHPLQRGGTSDTQPPWILQRVGRECRGLLALGSEQGCKGDACFSLLAWQCPRWQDAHAYICNVVLEVDAMNSYLILHFLDSCSECLTLYAKSISSQCWRCAGFWWGKLLKQFLLLHSISLSCI